MEQAPFAMWTKRNQTLNRNPSYDDDYSWEEQAFAEDALGPLGGCVWPPRSYFCSFCRREFRSAQALGGHMNVHRRDRARLKQSPAVSQVFDPRKDQFQNSLHHVSMQLPNLPPQDNYGYNPNPKPNPKPNCDLLPTTFVSPTSPNSRVSASPSNDDHGNNRKMNPFCLTSNTKPAVPTPQSRPNSTACSQYWNTMMSWPETRNSEDIGLDEDDSIKDGIPLSLNFLIRARPDAVSSIDKEEVEVRGGGKRRRLDDSSLLPLFFFDEIDRSEKMIHEFSSITGKDDLDLELRLGSRPNKKVKGAKLIKCSHKIV